MIEVRDLVKTFEGFRALDGISLSAPKGGVYGLVGPNGSGKSTLLRHLSGVYRPDSGSVTFGGAPVYENPELKSRIAYIPDDLYHFTSANILDMKKFYKNLYPNFSEERYQTLRGVFELNEKMPIRRMSKGMQKHDPIRVKCLQPAFPDSGTFFRVGDMEHPHIPATADAVRAYHITPADSQQSL